jgi:hypothetical protein
MADGEKEMNLSERVAKLVVEHMLPGISMRFRSEQSSGEHDFDLKYSDGPVVPLEVTMSASQRMKWLAAKLANQREGGRFVKAVKCRNGWYVHPLPDSNIEHIRKNVDRYLAQIEAESITEFFAWTDAIESLAVDSIFRDLKIEAGRVFAWKDARRIGIALPAQAGRVTSDSVQRAVETEAHKPDNRRKLGGTTHSEAHLFVYIDPLHYLPWIALVDEAPPKESLSLPAEITHIWAVAITRSPNEYIVWRASRRGNWCPPKIIVATLPTT